MSLNFLDRYRLRALIVELIELDHGETPLADRNIDWLLDRYFKHIIPRDLKNRIITDPSLEREISLEPRHPRHIPLAEIKGYFASHAEWLLANQLASSSSSANVRLVDIPQWISFCLQVRAEVTDARRNGIRWGIPHETGINSSERSSQNLSLSQRLAKYGQTESFWAKKLENVMAQRKARKTKHSKVSCLSHLFLYWILYSFFSIEVSLPRLGHYRPQCLLSLVNFSTTRISLRHLRMPHPILKMNRSIQYPRYHTSASNLQISPMVDSCGAVLVVTTMLIF
jgi:hypothetical protein